MRAIADVDAAAFDAAFRALRYYIHYCHILHFNITAETYIISARCRHTIDDAAILRHADDMPPPLPPFFVDAATIIDTPRAHDAFAIFQRRHRLRYVL